MADTSIRLWHVGSYRYGWEDAGSPKERYGDYTFQLPGDSGAAARIRARPVADRGVHAGLVQLLRPAVGQLLVSLAGKPVRAGGRRVRGAQHRLAARTRLDSPQAHLTWVDTFQGGADRAGMDLTGLEQRFRTNTARFAAKTSDHVGRSQNVLRDMTGEQFDLIYIDDSHEVADVLADAVLGWPLLKPGGLLGFDDYAWRAFPEPEQCPASGIDGFLAAHRGRYEELHRGHQIWVRRTR